MQLDPRNSSTLAIGTMNGIFLSYDSGTNWTGSCLTNPYTNQGQHMTGLILRDNGSGTDIYAAVGSVITGNTVLTNAINGADGIYKATMPAAGCPTNWSFISTPANGWPAGTGSGIPGSQGGNPVGRVDIAMAPTNHDYVYAQVHNPAASSQGQLGVWRTTDGGVTWASAQMHPRCETVLAPPLIPRKTGTTRA